jgi:hypothetical protein
MVEAYSIVEVDFSYGPKIVSDESEVQRFFDRLAEEAKRRNPGLLGQQ